MNRLRITWPQEEPQKEVPNPIKEYFFSTIAILTSLILFFSGANILGAGLGHENPFVGVIYSVLGAVVALGLPLAVIFLFFVLDLIHWE